MLLARIPQPDYRVLAARSGEQALILAAGEPPDPVLLDITMPEMDGYTVLTRLREPSFRTAHTTGRTGR
ncbi:MAG: response regulator [Betaproteobacteria bacterium]|nr:response regulator [Betaproteobacteria bacterium]